MNADPPCLYLDVGNTRTKLARPVGGEGWDLLGTVPTEEQAVRDLLEEAAEKTGSREIRACSVAPRLTTMLEKRQRGRVTLFTSRDIPPSRTFHKPSTALGADRFLLCAGAWSASGRRPAIVLGAGTALTIDLVHEDGRHLGGAILPGVETLRRGFHRAMPHLPEPPFERPGAWPATTTPNAIVWGLAGMLGLAVDGLLERSRLRLIELGSDEPPELWLSGGDADRLADAVPGLAAARRDPYLLFRGLRQQSW